jgi:hypothetical protein
MHRLPRLTALLTLSACAPGAGSITGTITTDDGSVGEVDAVVGLGFDQGGKLILYLSSNPATTCEGVVAYWTRSEPIDPVDLYLPGKCNLFISQADGYDGAFAAQDDIFAAAGTAIECAMDDGDWVLEERDTGDVDYYYQGRWWQGHPTTYTYDFSGGGGEDYDVHVDMSAYEGSFIYEDLTRDPASGAVSGDLRASWCGELGTTGL